MVASRQVGIPFYRAVGRQRGRGFGALAQVIGRTAIHFLRKYVVPATKRIRADMLEFAASEIGEVFSGRKTFKTAASSVGKKTPQKQLGSGSKQKRLIPTKLTKQSSRSRRDFFTKISRWSCQITIFVWYSRQCCMVNRVLTFSQLLKCFIQIQKLDCV